MSRDYCKVSPAFWTGETGKVLRAMGPEVQIVALYVLTCQTANMIGLYYLPIPTICHETGLSPKGASKALRRLSEGAFAYYDEDFEVVWVPEMARFQVGESLNPNDKNVKGVQRMAEAYKKCRFFKEFWQKYQIPFCLPDLKTEAPSKPLRSPFQENLEVQKPLRSQEQEHEREIEQEQEHDNPPTPKGGMVIPEPIPQNLKDHPGFIASWERFCQHRREIKKPMTRTAESTAINRLSGWGPVKAMEAIENSIANSWQGLFEPGKNGSYANKPKTVDIGAELAKDILAKEGGK